MRLARQHGNDRLDAASARAIALGSRRLHTVKNILATGQDHSARGDGFGRTTPLGHALNHD